MVATRVKSWGALDIWERRDSIESNERSIKGLSRPMGPDRPLQSIFDRRSVRDMRGSNTRHYDRKLDQILRHAAAVFCARGYHRASIRDIARATGVSLAGLYYYFSSKEELLYLIQRHAFETILAGARAALQAVPDAEERLRTFVRLHIKFFLEHPNEMKVLTHEEMALEDRWRREVHAIKKAYYGVCYDQVEALKRLRKLKGLSTRVAVLALFGMMNWIYTWYRPKVDPDAGTMAQQLTEIFLRGIFGARSVVGTHLKPAADREAKTLRKADSNGSTRRPRLKAGAIPRTTRREAARVELV